MAERKRDPRADSPSEQEHLVEPDFGPDRGALHSQGQNIIAKLSAEDEAWIGQQHIAPTSGKSLMQRLSEAGVPLSTNVEDLRRGPFSQFEPHDPDVAGRFVRWSAALYATATALEEEFEIHRPPEYFAMRKLANEGWATLDGGTKTHLMLRHPAMSIFAAFEARRFVLEEEDLKKK